MICEDWKEDLEPKAVPGTILAICFKLDARRNHVRQTGGVLELQH